MEASLTKDALAILAATEKRGTRPVLECGMIGDGEIVAADGYMLARYPVECRGDPILVLATELKAAGIMKDNGMLHMLESNGRTQLTGKFSLLPSMIDGRFPDYKELVPDFKPHHRVALGKSVLKKLIACMGSSDILRLEFPEGVGADAIRWSAGQANGVIMPMTVRWD